MQTAIPIVDSRFACIATNEGLALAAIISSYFNDAGVYFAVFEYPTLNFALTPAIDAKSDGYYSRVLGEKAATEINNALARIQPDTILLVGISEAGQSYIRSRMPGERLVEVNRIEDFLSRFSPEGNLREPLSCKPNQIVEGLLTAKFAGTTLSIDENAPDLPRQNLGGRQGLIVVEGGSDVHDLAAINYAAAFNLDVIIIPALGREAIRPLPQILAKWSDDKSHFEFKLFERKALKPLKGIDFTKYEFATFFTLGVPYGLFLKNAIPFSHVWKQVDCGIFIVVNLMDDDNPRAFGSSLHFSPQAFPTEETADVVRMFSENNFIPKGLVGEDATARNLTNYAGYYPYDLLHICSHGGETKGYFVLQEFKDRQGASHKVEYYEVIQIDPVDGVMAQLTQKMIYQRFDGFKWGSPELRMLPAYIFDDMSVAMREGEKVIRVPVKDPIAFSCHIECYGGLHQGAFHSLSDIGRPVVFNNSCSSSHELSPIFVDAGARAYIGTLWRVGNITAKNAAIAFYTELFRAGSLLSAFHSMVKLQTRDKDANVYIFWGLHFSTLKKPTEKSDDRIFGALLHSFLMWMRKIQTTADPVIERNAIPIAEFLQQELLASFTPDRLKALQEFDIAELTKSSQSEPDEEDDGFTRGIDADRLPPKASEPWKIRH